MSVRSSPWTPRSSMQRSRSSVTIPCCGFSLLKKMRKALLLVACATLLLCQRVTAEEGLLNKLLRITGISATPSQQKAPGEEIEAGGEIWISNVKAGTLERL